MLPESADLGGIGKGVSCWRGCISYSIRTGIMVKGNCACACAPWIVLRTSVSSRPSDLCARIEKRMNVFWSLVRWFPLPQTIRNPLPEDGLNLSRSINLLPQPFYLWLFLL